MPRKIDHSSENTQKTKVVQADTPDAEIKKLKKQIKLLKAEAKMDDEEMCCYVQTIRTLRRDIERVKKLADLWKNTVETQRLQLEVSFKQTDFFRNQLTQHRNSLLKDREDKLIAHGLISGKSKVLTPCDSCSLNGNCRFQEMNKGKWADCTIGPFKMDIDNYIKVAKFPLDQVDYWDNSDIKN